ncbi:PE PGRS family protein [Mycobacterium tuberculosis]|nr:PE PGRS family protein [Mycobacterium tuberculosis]
MSYVIAAPEALVAAATDLATLGSTIGAANAAAANEARSAAACAR